jgi:hypothetical protein
MRRNAAGQPEKLLRPVPLGLTVELNIIPRVGPAQPGRYSNKFPGVSVLGPLHSIGQLSKVSERIFHIPSHPPPLLLHTAFKMRLPRIVATLCLEGRGT